jgi:hypothetical protein
MGAFVKSFVHLDVENVDSAITGQLKCAPKPVCRYTKFIGTTFPETSQLIYRKALQPRRLPQPPRRSVSHFSSDSERWDGKASSWRGILRDRTERLSFYKPANLSIRRNFRRLEINDGES